MKLVGTISGIRDLLRHSHVSSSTIGLIPTMGAFHKGHIALMLAARSECDTVVVSLYVNPAQFGPNEDLKNYPRDMAKDKRFAEEAGVDILFTPSNEEMYPPGFLSHVEVKDITEKLCGRYRPGHFRGVATVVAKLFNIIQPNKAFFGEKDWQQLVVIRKMVYDLNLPVEIVSIPTVRDADGLAVSSRNQYLSVLERKRALVIPESLKIATGIIKKGEHEAEKIKQMMKNLIASTEGVELEYLSICRPDNFTELREIKETALIALAAMVGRTRLIDNILVKAEELKTED